MEQNTDRGIWSVIVLLIAATIGVGLTMTLPEISGKIQDTIAAFIPYIEEEPFVYEEGYFIIGFDDAQQKAIIYGFDYDKLNELSDQEIKKIKNNLTVPSVIEREENGETYIVATIEDGAFNNEGLSGRLNILNNIDRIGVDAFSGNDITSVKLGNKITYISDNAFRDNNIKTLSLNKDLEYIQDNAFANNKISSLKFNEKLNIIGHGAFKNNLLKEVIFNEDGFEIGVESFAENKIEKVSLPKKIYAIYEGAFRDNVIKEINIPSNVIEVGAYAFANNRLVKVNMEDGVKILYYSAFINNEIKDLSLPNSIEQIGPSVFRENSLESISIPENTWIVGESSFAQNNLKEIEIQGGEQNLEIGSFAFYGNEVEHLIIPERVSGIYERAFYQEVSKLNTLELYSESPNYNFEAFAGHQDREDKPNLITSIADIEFYQQFNGWNITKKDAN